jgi:hypothetical protein
MATAGLFVFSKGLAFITRFGKMAMSADEDIRPLAQDRKNPAFRRILQEKQ